MQPSLGQRLRAATKALHTEVERAGVMRRLLRGDLAPAGYCLLLRNLHALYEALEAAIQTNHALPALQTLVPPTLWRTPALQHDLLLLHGNCWRAELPVAPAAQAYVLRLASLAVEQPALLAAHAYVRYLGDLNGGQMLARLVAPLVAPLVAQLVAPLVTPLVTPLVQAPERRNEPQALQTLGLAFYRFEGTTSVDTLQTRFRLALNEQAQTELQAQALVQEACSAFVRHRDLFVELESLSPPPQSAGGPVSSLI